MKDLQSEMMRKKLLSLRREVSSEATPRLCGLNLLERGRRLALWKNSAFQRLVSSLWQVVNGSRELSAQVGRSPVCRVEEGA